MDLQNFKWMKEGGIDLLVESYSSSAMVLQIRGFNDDSMIVADLTTTADRLVVSESIAITTMPRALTVRSASTKVKRGTCYVRISLRVEGVIVETLFSNYVTDSVVPAYPNGSVVSSLEGPGLMRSILGTDPAAGVEIAETVPTNAAWKLKGVLFTLVTDATVASREPHLVIDDGTNIIFEGGISGAITAGSSLKCSLSNVASSPSSSGVRALVYLPHDPFLFEDFRIRTLTGSFQAGDNYAAPRLLVEEWINP